MKISLEQLTVEADATQFRADMLEKAVRLLAVLEAACDHPHLEGQLALKGGTALNLFVLSVPRLSVDIDLNYVGAASRKAMLEERPRIEAAIQAVLRREGFTVRRVPQEHAGGKWSFRYASAFGSSGRLELDLNFMHRVSLWPVVRMDSHPLGSWRATGIPVVDLHELAAGKLAALLSRRKARDLFDTRLLLSTGALNPKRLRIAFVVYGAMNRKDWRTISSDDVAVDVAELVNNLMPLLYIGAVSELGDAAVFGDALVSDCRRGLSAVLPFTDAELAFLDLLLEEGTIDASLLTTDTLLQERIEAQPLLAWKALHVRRHKRLS